MNLGLRNCNLEFILNQIESTPSGRKLREKFRSIQTTFSIGLHPYPNSLAQRLREVVEPLHPLGAATVWDTQSAMIYYDCTESLGVLIPYLAHEMAHGIEAEKVLSLHGSPISNIKKSQIVFELERSAFDWQFKIIQELKDLDSEVSQFYREHYSHVWTLRACPSDHDIKIHYRLQDQFASASSDVKNY